MKSWLENFLTHRPLLFRVIGRIVRPDEIEDIVQETFLHSFAAARKHPIGNPRAFMVTTARNIALNHIKRADRRLNAPLEEALEADYPEWTATAEHSHLSEEKFRIFCRAVAELPSGCRKVFVLKKVYGMSQQEIADCLGISPSTVEKHVAKGLALTAAYMDRKGYTMGFKVKAAKKSDKEAMVGTIG